MMRNTNSILKVLAASAILASCQSTGPTLPTVANTPPPETTPPPAAPKPATVDKVAGKWVPTNAETRKIYYNEFKGGKFAAYTVDGKSTLALGSYKSSDNGVKFEYFSQTRKRQVKADCKLAGPTRMTCRIDDGSVVELQKA